jgi:hypothetical protein
LLYYILIIVIVLWGASLLAATGDRCSPIVQTGVHYRVDTERTGYYVVRMCLIY